MTAVFGIAVPPAPRNDLVTIFLTGIPGLNQPPNVRPSEMLRLNTGIPPVAPNTGGYSNLGVLGGDVGGFPNGRRVGDDVLDIAVRAVAGATPLTPAFNRSPNNTLGDGVNGNDVQYSGRLPVSRRAAAGQSLEPVARHRRRHWKQTSDARHEHDERHRLLARQLSGADRAGSADDDTGGSARRQVAPGPGNGAGAPSAGNALGPASRRGERRRRRGATGTGARRFSARALKGRVGDPGGLSTARDDLSRAVSGLEQRLGERPSDTAAASRLADVLLRQSRVLNNPGLAVRAEDVLRAALKEVPEDYESTRMLGAVLLSQHRFRDAIEIATRARAFNEHDAWNYGVLGDAWLELGDYQRAFDTFDEMMRRRPSAAAYARVAYAKELQGDLNGALQLMRMATDATSAHDPEGQAWHHVQVGDLLFKQGKLSAARREYDHAAFIFADHPMAAEGLARVMAAEQNFAGALAIYEDLMAKGQLPHLAARAGDMHARLGHDADAAKMYALAENGWRFDTPEPAALVGFLAKHDRAHPRRRHARRTRGGVASGCADDGCAGVGVFQGGTHGGRAEGVEAGAAHGHARAFDPVSCGRDSPCGRRHGDGAHADRSGRRRSP